MIGPNSRAEWTRALKEALDERDEALLRVAELTVALNTVRPARERDAEEREAERVALIEQLRDARAFQDGRGRIAAMLDRTIAFLMVET